MLTAIAYILATQDHPVFVAVAMAAVAGSFLVSYTRAKAENLGLRGDVGIGSRAERVVVITAGLVLAPWGVLPWALVLLACTAWITVGQRVLHVRKQLIGGNRIVSEMNGSNRGRQQDKVRVAIIGVGNCANSFMQGLDLLQGREGRTSSSRA